MRALKHPVLTDVCRTSGLAWVGRGPIRARSSVLNYWRAGILYPPCHAAAMAGGPRHHRQQLEDRRERGSSSTSSLPIALRACERSLTGGNRRDNGPPPTALAF